MAAEESFRTIISQRCAFASEKNRRYVAVAINNSNEQRIIRFQLSDFLWKPGHAGGLVTDTTRTLESQLILAVPAAELRYEAQIPPLSVATFVCGGKRAGADGVANRHPEAMSWFESSDNLWGEAAVCVTMLLTA